MPITVEELVSELEQEAATTRRVLARVPEDRLAWRPHPRSMSLGELSLHLANLPDAIAGLAMLPEFDAATPVPLPEAASAAELLATHDRSVAGAVSQLRAMGDAGLGEPWRLLRDGAEMMTMPRGALLRVLMLNHAYHHRGQLSVYLRLAETPVPSIYGPSADELPF
ncbi:DinB family protein [Roseisolibacter sp. H3M3-2]|uniref:DinB family protein n=1 Tax=Roseisolibacter sp. H3M3-2 TaxID=3031323 RepID=UPI0023DBD3F0|nr:DinB family protein [Roseisolibacter sp. H3M3-2]MDF1503384.1 DinB family protein [Roseisolibacter sp. H3M3-2]